MERIKNVETELKLVKQMLEQRDREIIDLKAEMTKTDDLKKKYHDLKQFIQENLAFDADADTDLHQLHFN